MQLALRIEKAAPPSHLAICEAAAMAVVWLLADETGTFAVSTGTLPFFSACVDAVGSRASADV